MEWKALLMADLEVFVTKKESQLFELTLLKFWSGKRDLNEAGHIFRFMQLGKKTIISNI